ncbi:MAG: DUF6600 domain-containing protein [Bryobacteraceae bacterium]
MKRRTWKLLAAILAMAGLAWAQDDDDLGRGVARLSLLNGDVSVRRGDSGDWVAAAVNAPLVVEDSVITGVNSRAEIQFDWANMIRLSSNTEVRLAELQNRRYMVQVVRGLVTFRVLRDFDVDVEISTPSVSVRPMKRGTYRIAVLAQGESEITVRSGEAEIYTPRGSERLRSGRTMLARGSASDPEYRIISAVSRDSWDRWNEDRDRFFTRAASYRYVHSSVYGAYDLDHHGSWVYVAPYGWVWSPRVVVGWSPYYYGRWTWVDWYGWTWVSYEPWGWAPYHYGRWFYSGPHGWCWWPGGWVRHPWRPALVAFVGWSSWSSGVTVGIGFGRIGWVPLAPYEPYYPWYGRRLYAGYRNTTIIDNSVHIVNNTNIVNIYSNARVVNGVTAVDASEFGRGGARLVRISQDEMRRVDLVRGLVPVAPRRESLRLAERDTGIAPPVQSAGVERFVTRRQPARVERISFEEQQRAMEHVVRRTLREPDAMRRADGERPQPGADVPRTGQGTVMRPGGATNNNGAGGWRRIGEPRNTAMPGRDAGGVGREPAAPAVRRIPAETAPSSSDGGGWRRIGVGDRTSPADVAPRPPEAPSPGAPTIRRIPAEAVPSGGEDGSWRRFGSGSAPSERMRDREPRPVTPSGNAPQVYRIPAENSTPPTDGGSWRRFEGSGSVPSESRPTVHAPVRPTERRSVPYTAPRAPEARPTPRYEGAPIRISPPIVRQREAAPTPPPRVSEPRSPGGGFGSPRVDPGGGGGRVTRSSEAPARTRSR